MNDSERLQLQKMIKANDTQNNTQDIRRLKHSKKILADVDMLLKLKQDNKLLAKSNPESFDSMCTNKCSFLFNNYTDIYNKVLKDEINLQILERLINVLYSIEEGEVDQHEGSFEVGKLLKNIYIDSALKKADKINEQYEKKEEEKPIKPISWREFKNKNK
tara:strand:- start:60 stop:542 length:483 start_codon:yes stop_codon:yes gene_type:complete